MIERVLAGDAAAFEPLVTPYRCALQGLAVRIVRDPEDAKEVAQEALLRAYRYLGSFDRRLGFRNWLYQIAVNTARSFQRKRLDRDIGLDRAAPEIIGARAAENPEVRHDRAAIRARLMACLNVLSDREREVFLLRDIEDLNVEETARVLGSSAISVRVHLSAARRKIRTRFLELNGPSAGSGT
ncbi:MAG: RNA polymerase sigma factor [Acidobacteriota bacterium]|nr:RNA polymerase sigma factor [Acidobacteriota bacterium]